MPINYKLYPPNWLSEIRPKILKRAENKCEVCGVENYNIIFRCKYNDKEYYQMQNGNLYDAENSELAFTNTYYFELEPLNKDRAIKIILTIAHLNHNTSDNRDENLKAMCQRCHLRYDAKHHAETRKKKQNKNQLKLF